MELQNMNYDPKTHAKEMIYGKYQEITTLKW